VTGAPPPQVKEANPSRQQRPLAGFQVHVSFSASVFSENCSIYTLCFSLGFHPASSFTPPKTPTADFLFPRRSPPTADRHSPTLSLRSCVCPFLTRSTGAGVSRSHLERKCRNWAPAVQHHHAFAHRFAA
jgi:hypothetical protein